MEFNLKDNLKVHNRYEFELVDSITGKVKQRAHAENVVLNQLWTLWNTTSSLSMFAGIAMGTGSGTPAATDTALFTQAFRYTSAMTQVSRSEVYPTCTYTYRTTIPATSSYVGALTEVGILGHRTPTYFLWTHAILKDAENNPITINKTDLDQLTVTVTVHVTFSSSSPNFTWYRPGAGNKICNAFREASSVNSPVDTSISKLCHCTTINLDSNGCISSITSPSAVRLGTAAFNASTKTITIPSVRMGTAVGNDVYYQGAVIGSPSANAFIGGIVYPNSNIFPNQTITGMRVGTGDGTTTHFDIPIEYFVAGTDVVKVNGTTMVRGTDYTIDNADELMTANDTMALSNFLEPVSGIDVPSTYNLDGITGTAGESTVPFTHYKAENGLKAALKSNDPLVLKVSDCAACCNVSKAITQSLTLLTRWNRWGSFLSPFADLMIYETRQNLTLPTVTVTSTLAEAISGIISDIVTNPSAYSPVSAQNTLVTKVKASIEDGYNIAIIHPVSYTIYYMWVQTSTIKHLVMVTRGNVTPFSGFISGRMHATTASPTLWELARGTQVVDGDTWTYYYTTAQVTSLYYCNEITTNCFCTIETMSSLSTLLNGCNIVLSGSTSAQGPWTEVATVDLSSLTEVPSADTHYTYYKATTAQCAISTCAYDYYKVELDLTDATNLDRYGTDPIMYMHLTNVLDEPSNAQAATLVLGYEGNGINFTTAPAQDAIITLDAAIDRPLKNSNFVIDAAMTLQF